MTTQGYFIEHNGECWQSVFPEPEAAKSQLHETIDDARSYMVSECGVPEALIQIQKEGQTL